MRAKLIEGQLVYAPQNAIYNNVKYIPAPDNILAQLGYKEVVYTTAPECTGETHPESSWTDGEQITQTWTVVEDDDATKCARRRDWFDTNYRKWNEMLTRYAAVGVAEEIEDEFRGKTYTTLAELYAEAEIVRAEINAMEGEEV